MKACWAALLPLLLSGCGDGSPTGSLSGKVTINGNPVAGAKVSMISSKSGSGALIDIGADGSFQSRDPLPVGSYKVAIVPNPPEPAAPGTKAAKGAPSEIPEKYQRPESSGFSAEVKAGRNEASFAIP